MPHKVAEPPSKSAKTSTAWLRPTELSRTTAGNRQLSRRSLRLYEARRRNHSARRELTLTCCPTHRRDHRALPAYGETKMRRAPRGLPHRAVLEALSETRAP